MNCAQEIGGGKRWVNRRCKRRLGRLRAENAQLKSKHKGGLSFPVTLYKEQWLRILASAPGIEAFIRENDSKLKDEGVGF
jgi:hypothetical protein